MFSRKNVLFSGIMEKQNVTLTSLAENQEKLLKLIQGLQQNQKLISEKTQDLQNNDEILREAILEGNKALFNQTKELIQKDRARIARLERYVEADMARRSGAKGPFIF